MKNNNVKIPPQINSRNVRSEAESRANILADAKLFGCEGEIRQAFARYDRMLTNCKNESERRDIAVMGAAEVYRIMGLKGGLSVDGVDIIPSNEEIKQQEKEKTEGKIKA